MNTQNCIKIFDPNCFAREAFAVAFKALFRDFEEAWTGYSQWLPF